MILNVDNLKSYKTEENLIKTIKKYNLEKYRYLIVKNRENRFTAIFSASDIASKDNNLLIALEKGFMIWG